MASIKLYQTPHDYINIDALHPALILWQQGFERVQVIAVDDHIAAVFRAVGIALFQNAVRHFLMVVDHLVLAKPVQYGHVVLRLLTQTFRRADGVGDISLDRLYPVSRLGLSVSLRQTYARIKRRAWMNIAYLTTIFKKTAQGRFSVSYQSGSTWDQIRELTGD